MKFDGRLSFWKYCYRTELPMYLKPSSRMVYKYLPPRHAKYRGRLCRNRRDQWIPSVSLLRSQSPAAEGCLLDPGWSFRRRRSSERCRTHHRTFPSTSSCRRSLACLSTAPRCLGLAQASVRRLSVARIRRVRSSVPARNCSTTPVRNCRDCATVASAWRDWSDWGTCGCGRQTATASIRETWSCRRVRSAVAPVHLRRRWTCRPLWPSHSCPSCTWRSQPQRCDVIEVDLTGDHPRASSST